MWFTFKQQVIIIIVMQSTINHNYAGFQPDELPGGLSDSSLTQSIELFFTKGGQEIRVSRNGSLINMDCLAKIIFFILDFFSLSTASRAEIVQYQFIKILYLAASRDLLNGKLEETISKTRIDQLLIGVSEAIDKRHNLPSLSSSLVKFSHNHEIKPGLLGRLLSATFPRDLLAEGEDFGLTHLSYASSFNLPCTYFIEPEVERALTFVDPETRMPSAKFCVKFVEVMRKQLQLFKGHTFNKWDKIKINSILRKALGALASEKRFPEAFATIEELRPRLLSEETLNTSDKVQLVLLYGCCAPKKVASLLNENDYSQFFSCNDLSRGEQRVFAKMLFNHLVKTQDLPLEKQVSILMTLLEYLVDDYDLELAKQIYPTLRFSFKTLVEQVPDRFKDTMVRLSMINEGKSVPLADLITTMDYFLTRYGKDQHEGWKMMVEAACYRFSQLNQDPLQMEIFYTAFGNNRGRIEQFLIMIRELGHDDIAQEILKKLQKSHLDVIFNVA